MGRKIMQNKDVKERLSQMLKTYVDTRAEGLLTEIKQCLHTLHDDILEADLVDGFIVSERKGFRDKIDDITGVLVQVVPIPPVHRDYYFSTENETVWVLNERFLTEEEGVYRQQVLQHRLSILKDDLDYALENEEWLIDEISELMEELRGKRRWLSDVQKDKLKIQNAILYCNENLKKD